MRTLAAVLGMGLLCACAARSPALRPAALQARMQGAEDQLVLVTVRNPPEPVPTRAASGLRGYDALSLYDAGSQARAIRARIAARHRLTDVAQWPIAALKVDCIVFEGPADRPRAQLLADLRLDRDVVLAEPLQAFETRAAAYNDPYYGLQRGFADIAAGPAQEWSSGEGIRIAVIDTGIDAEHPDLAGRIETTRNFVDEDKRRFAADRHGTEVAGVIGADANNREGIVGVAPGVRILALKACWQTATTEDEARCNSFTLAKALAIAIDSGARIINLSLGGPADPLLAQLLGYAIGRGIAVVGAMPPDGRRDGFPVGVPGVMAVETPDVPAHDPRVLRAPGNEILTLTPGGHYDFVSGSSLAAAHVSGAVALLMAANRKLDAGAIYALLRRTSIDAAGAAGTINVCAAVAAARSLDTCATKK